MQERPLRRLAVVVERFLRVEAASSIVLLLAGAVALVWANSPGRASYRHLFEVPIGAAIAGPRLARPLHFWINDGLMTIFFFVVGLEIRRELHGGELSTVRRAILPVLAAVGGMVAPALIYLALAGAGPARRGWGVPMATDIAFAVGVMTLLGARVPAALRILLLALAIVDDIGAILVIALFYSSGVAWWGLGAALAALLLILLLQKLGVRAPAAYLLPSIGVWLGVLESGVHPTIAGVVLGLCTPALAEPEASSPVDRLIQLLHPWVAWLIMPLFALANAGVEIGAVRFDGEAARVAIAAALGLVFGKPIGIVSICLLAIRLRIAEASESLRPAGLVLVGLVAGIGFTMAIFVSALAFQRGALADVAKLAVLGASTVAALLALLYGRIVRLGAQG